MSKVIPLYQTDEAIIEGIKKFDNAAVSKAYEMHKDYCIRYMERMYNDEDAIKDIYQDAVIVLIENIRHKNLKLEGTSIQTYLNSICKYQILTRFKSSGKMKNISKEEMEEQYGKIIVDWFEDLGDVNSRRIKIINEELMKMKEEGGKCYEILELFFFESRSMDYIANKLGYTNADNAKNQKSRCQKKLKTQVFNRYRSE
jgi:RNA polymerase sigma factor (sigma-70 family)